MDDTETFGSGALAAAALTVMLSQSFHAVILGFVWMGETAAWLVVVLSGVVALACYWPVARYLAARPGRNLLTVAADAAGSPGEIGTAVLLCAFLVLHAGLILRETAEMAVSTVYPHTPQVFAMVTLAGCALYCAQGGLVAAVRVCRLFLPVLCFAVAGIVFGAIGWAELDYLFPLWGPGPWPVIQRSPMLAAWIWPMLAVLYMGPAHLRDRQKLVGRGAIALGSAILAFAILKAVLVMVFPLPQGNSTLFPIHQLTRLVTGGRFFERIDSIWVCLWSFGTAIHLGLLLHLAASAFAQAFRLPDHRPAIVPLAVLFGTIALFPHNVSDSVAVDIARAPFSLAIMFVLPLLLTAIAAWRQRRWARRHA